MRGTWKLKSLHAKPEVSMPESKCSHRLCRPGACSCNEGNAEAKIFAREAGKRLARRHLLLHAVPAARAVFPHYPILLSR